MLRTIIITFSIGMIVGFAGTLLSLFGGGSLEVEYVEFAVALLLFLVILIGAYWFMIGGSSDTNERGRPGEKRRSPEKGKVP